MTFNQFQNSDQHEHRLCDLIDRNALQRLVDTIFRYCGVPMTIVDAFDSSYIVSAGTQDACERFHRIKPSSSLRCAESYNKYGASLSGGGPVHYQCLNGLQHIGLPIVADNQHLATLFISQFFYEDAKPSHEFFSLQAAEYGFEISSYRSALNNVPVFSRNDIQRCLDFNRELAAVISDMATRSVQMSRTKKDLLNSEVKQQSSRVFLNAIIENIPDMIFVKDARDLTFFSFNRAGEELLGRSRTELLGRDDYDFFPVEQADFFRAKDREVLESGTLTDIPEEVISTPHGDRILRTKKLPILDDDGTPLYLLGISEDITARKRLEEELVKAHKLESLGLLAGGLAHDFNNLLTAIIGNISLAEAMLSPEDRVTQRLKAAEKACIRMKDLSQRLLVFAKGGDPVKRNICLKDLLQNSVDLILSGTRTVANVRITDNLLPVCADDRYIRQVIESLVANASQAMPCGGTVDITIDNTILDDSSELPLAAGSYVRLTVSDHGIGIPEENLARIFDPYFTTRESSSGLGLALAYSIMNKHQGLITVSSEAQVGSTFTVYFPAGDKADTVCTPPGSSKRFAANILVMDDEDMVSLVVGDMLQHLGHEADFAKDGNEAIQKYVEANNNGRPYDLVILDLFVQKGLGGHDTMLRLLEIDPKVRAIVSSGYSDEPVMSEYASHGFAAAIVKPYNMNDLDALLSRILGPDAAPGA